MDVETGYTFFCLPAELELPDQSFSGEAQSVGVYDNMGSKYSLCNLSPVLFERVDSDDDARWYRN